MGIGHDGLLLVVGLVVLPHLTLPDYLSCPPFIYVVHFEVEFTFQAEINQDQGNIY